MAVDLQLQLIDSTTPTPVTFTFDLDSAFEPVWELEHNEAADPPELARITERWTMRARLIADDLDSLWDSLDSFLAEVEDRDTTPLVEARVVRDPGGAAEVERVLGPTGSQQGFRIESLSVIEDSILPAQQWRTSILLEIVAVATKEFPDGNGITGWEQIVRNSAGPDALRTIEWEITARVAEGAATSALDQLKTFGVIPIASFGNTYVWDTNSGEGFDWEELDADTRPSPDRTPTRIRSVSRIKQKGISVGTPSAGNSVGDVSFSTEEVTDDEGVFRKFTRASAVGPGALSFVLNQKPTGSIRSSRVLDDRAGRRAEAEWVQGSFGSVSSQDQGQNRNELTIVLSGGHQDEELTPISGNFRPVLQVGPFQPYRLEVTSRRTFIGPQPSRSDMKLPAILGSPWRLQRNLSREDPVPKRIRASADPGADEWERGATAIYLSASEPGISSLDPLFGSNTVDTYLL